MCKKSIEFQVAYETKYDRDRREVDASESLARGENPVAPPPTIWLELRRYLSDDEACGRKPVLLLHGASANHGSFTAVDGGLAKYLADTRQFDQQFDPWLLDWRGSSRVVDDKRNLPALAAGESFNFNTAAQIDVPAALGVMRQHGAKGLAAVIGHCMGAGVLAEAVANGAVTTDAVDRVVLQTLGLFYQTPFDSRLKSEDRMLERLSRGIGTTGPFMRVDPRIDLHTGVPKPPWPAPLDGLYENWPSRMFHDTPARGNLQRGQPMDPQSAANLQCNRVSFMYGLPYSHENLADEIHGTDINGRPILAAQFGAIPLHMYIHAAKNIRHGYATTYNTGGKMVPKPIVTNAARDRFMSLDKVTLIAGGLNRLWHRDSIDLMHAWLTRGPSADFNKVQKHVFPDFAHQDLLWAPPLKRKQVFEAIGAAL